MLLFCTERPSVVAPALGQISTTRMIDHVIGIVNHQPSSGRPPATAIQSPVSHMQVCRQPIPIDWTKKGGPLPITANCQKKPNFYWFGLELPWLASLRHFVPQQLHRQPARSYRSARRPPLPSYPSFSSKPVNLHHHSSHPRTSTSSIHPPTHPPNPSSLIPPP